MKRLISIAVFIICCMSLSACNKTPEPKRPLSDAHNKYGTKALEIVDAYLDFTISASDAYKQIDELYSSANALPKVEKSDTTYYGNYFVEHDVSMIRYELRDISSGRGSYENLKEKRDDLAEELGLIIRPHETQAPKETTMPYAQQQEIASLVKEVFGDGADVYMFDQGEEVFDLSVYFSSSDKALFADWLNALLDAANLVEAQYGFSFTNITLGFRYEKNGEELYLSWHSKDGGKTGQLSDGTIGFGIQVVSADAITDMWGAKNTSFTMPTWE